MLGNIVQSRLKICHICYEDHYWTHLNCRLLEWSFMFDRFSFRGCWRLTLAVPHVLQQGVVFHLCSFVMFFASIDPVWRQKNHNLFHVVKRPVLWSLDPLEMTKCPLCLSLLFLHQHNKRFLPIFICFLADQRCCCCNEAFLDYGREEDAGLYDSVSDCRLWICANSTLETLWNIELDSAWSCIIKLTTLDLHLLFLLMCD